VSWESVFDCIVVGSATEIDRKGGFIPLDSAAFECYLWGVLTGGIQGDRHRTDTSERPDAAGG
jgi:hypothetical protein